MWPPQPTQVPPLRLRSSGRTTTTSDKPVVIAFKRHQNVWQKVLFETTSDWHSGCLHKIYKFDLKVWKQDYYWQGRKLAAAQNISPKHEQVDNKQGKWKEMQKLSPTERKSSHGSQYLNVKESNIHNQNPKKRRLQKLREEQKQNKLTTICSCRQTRRACCWSLAVCTATDRTHKSEFLVSGQTTWACASSLVHQEPKLPSRSANSRSSTQQWRVFVTWFHNVHRDVITLSQTHRIQ